MRSGISNDNHLLVNADGSQNTYDTSDEDVRPLKLRRSRPARAATPPRHSQDDNGCLSATDDKSEVQTYFPKLSRSQSAAAKAAPTAKSQDWHNKTKSRGSPTTVEPN